MSRPLFLTSMMRPETMFIDAISTRTDRMMNITLSSMSSARRKLPEASRHVQISPRSPAARNKGIAISSTVSGYSTMISISSATPSRLK